jgi:hypothetical protein
MERLYDCCTLLERKERAKIIKVIAVKLSAMWLRCSIET